MCGEKLINHAHMCPKVLPIDPGKTEHQITPPKGPFKQW